MRRPFKLCLILDNWLDTWPGERGGGGGKSAWLGIRLSRFVYIDTKISTPINVKLKLFYSWQSHLRLLSSCSPGMKFQYSEFQKGRLTRWGSNSIKPSTRTSVSHPPGRIHEYQPHGIEYKAKGLNWISWIDTCFICPKVDTRLLSYENNLCIM